MKLNIVVPLFNQGRFLEECLVSIFKNKTEIPFKIMVVNDCSTDDSLQVANELALQAPKVITVISTPENKGLSGAINFGFKMSNIEEDDLVMILHADDMIMDNYIQQNYKNIIEHKVDISYTDMYLFGDLQTRLDVPEFKRSLLQKSPFIHYASIFKAAAFEKVGGYDEEIKNCWEDYELWIRMIRANYIPRKCPSSTLLFRQHQDSMTAKVNVQDFESTRRKIRSKHFSFVMF